MSIMTELFVCTPAEASHYDADSSSKFEHVQLGGLTCLEFGTLWAILDNETWDVDKHMLSEVASTDETWIHAFPDECVTKLVALQPSEISNAAEQWAATEELDGTEPSDLEAVIEQLVAIARSARKQGKALFVWVSL